MITYQISNYDKQFKNKLQKREKIKDLISNLNRKHIKITELGQKKLNVLK